MSYVDDDDSDIGGGGGEVTFTGTSRSKKSKVSDTTFDMVDVSPHCVVVIVIAFFYSRHHIAGNFRGRKLSRIGRK